MCEAAVYIDRDGRREEIMQGVVTIKPEGDHLLLTDLFGSQKMVKAVLKEVCLLDHKVILEDSS